MSFESLLVQRLDVQRQSAGAANAWGGKTGAWPTVNDDPVPCRSFSPRGREVTDAAGRRIRIDLSIDVLPDADITPDDRVVLDGRTYNVLAVDEVGAGHHRTLQVRSL